MEKEVIGVRFLKGYKTYYFDPHGFRYKLNEKLVVNTVNGLEVGVVTKENFVTNIDGLSELQKVERKCNEHDFRTIKKHEQRANSVFKDAEKLIKDMKLDMKLLQVECSFEGNKLIFTYSAEDRVDFRELLKEMASKFKARIELKQIGIRDEARLLGGLGPCGKEICCRKFLSDFDKVTLKYAKNQGLALNSNKLSGMCGRLMCCLSYENKMYVDLLNKMPKINSTVKTKDGTGIVVYNNLLKEKVTVKINVDEDTTKLIEYSLDELL